MKRLITISLVLFEALICSAQTPIKTVLSQIEANNPSLAASKNEVLAEQTANKSLAIPANPEVEFNYLWGADDIGNRHDIRISQSFDIPTIIGMKSRLAGKLNDMSTMRYEADRLQILLEAESLCIDLVSNRQLLGELKEHLKSAETLVTSYQKKFDAGASTILDINKAKLHLASVKAEIARTEIENNSLVLNLESLNGGKSLDLSALDYDYEDNLPTDFSSWFAEVASRNPDMRLASQEVLVGQKELALEKASWLPELSVGYMGEIRTAEKFRGVTVGIGIPLWSNANKVKQTKAKVAASISRQNEVENKFRTQLLNLYNNALSLKDYSETMRESLKETDNRQYLLSAQTRGEISILDYLVEVDMYYDSLTQTLMAERDYRKSLAELNALTL